MFGYQVVPGYADEQLSPDIQVAVPLQVAADGTFNADPDNRWTYAAPYLELHWANGQTKKVIVEQGRDWENKKPCLIFTGLNDAGAAVWGKK